MKLKLLLLSITFCAFSFVLKAQILQGTATLSSANNMSVKVTVNNNTNSVEIELKGPNTKWHAVGFGGSSMSNTYATIVNGSGTAQERKLGNHNSGSSLSSSFTSTSSTVSGSVRTTIMERPRVGLNSNYFTFSNTPGSITLIWGKGSSSSLSNHGSGNRGSSIISLTNICNIPTTVLTEVKKCEGDSALIFGAYRTVAGIYKDTLQTSIGCDSVISQELKISPNGPFPLPSTTICNGDSVSIFGEYRMISGTYSDTLTNINNCDSIIEQALIVNMVDVAVNMFTDSLVANAQGAAYQWIDCANNMAISGETNRTFLPTVNGNYKVEVTENNCIDTSDCVVYMVNNIAENILKERIVLYPNPATDYLVIDFKYNGDSFAYKITNAIGQIVSKNTAIGNSSEIGLSKLSKGIYFITITQNGVSATQKLIIQ